MVVTGMRQTQGEVSQCGSDWYEAHRERSASVVVTGMRQTQGGQPVW